MQQKKLVTLVSLVRAELGAAGTHKVYTLFIVDLLTKVCHLEFMNRATAPEVVAALKSFSHQYRMPRVCVADCGSQLRCLGEEKNPLFHGLKMLGIKIEAVNARHQFLNFSERVYAELKHILESMRCDADRSVYDQTDTQVELSRKFSLAVSIMNTAPVLVKHVDSGERIVMKQALLKPFLTAEVIDDHMKQVMLGVAGSHDTFFDNILTYSTEVKQNVKNKILAYLQEKAVSYPDLRLKGKQVDSHTLLPLANDVVLYADSTGHLHFAVIAGIVSKNVVNLKIIRYGKPEMTNTHVSLIKLVYRSENPDCYLNISKC